jgi:hypothetical protein
VALLQLKEHAVNMMINKFLLLDSVYNRNTREDGTIRRIYETNGGAMYEVTMPQQDDDGTTGYYVSDWAEDVLQLSDNALKFSSNHGLKAH